MPELFARALEALLSLGVDARAPFAALAGVASSTLKGPFDPSDARHRAFALGVAALFGKRLADAHGAFFFPQREAPSIGFPHLLLVVEPLALVEEALRAGDLARLDARAAELDAALPKDGARGLTAAHYAALFDPAFLRFVLVDETGRVVDGTAFAAEAFWADVVLPRRGGVLGVFSDPRAIGPRRYAVDAAELPPLDPAPNASRAPADAADVVEAARARRAELEALRRRAAPGLRLAFERATAADVGATADA